MRKNANLPDLSSGAARALAIALLEADSESAVIDVLESAGLWSDDKAWRNYGDIESNFSTIGNQQSRPEAALVEKVVNSVDARLLDACYREGIDPTGEDAPRSISDAVARFFEEGQRGSGYGGHLKDWPQARQLEQSRFITLAVTGAKARSGNACITIADMGEGQTPSRVPETFLSINRQNKLRIPFVQGKFNMGGTGVLKFCGEHNLQLVITRRDPQIPSGSDTSHPDDDRWSVTVVRRERPRTEVGAVRNSVYRYLAPVRAESDPRGGDLLTFGGDPLKAMPERNKPYAVEMPHGSIVKLYEYDMKGFRSHALMKGGLLGRLELLLPGIALPVRLHECREYRGDEARSFENSIVGLLARLEEDRAGNLEDGYPTSLQFRVRGEVMTAQVFAFKEDKATTYAPNDGIIFVVNGQTHGTLPRTFYERRNVRMQRIARSLLVVVDCSALSVGAREDLFMNSRDRLSSVELRKAIEEELEEAIGHHPGLRELRDARRRDEIEKRLADSKPLEDVLGEILKDSPTLARLFLLGQRLSRPHKQTGGTGDNGGGPANGRATFSGRPHPTFFRFHGRQDGAELDRNAELGRRCRIRFETDAANDYFSRDEVPGQYYVEVLDGPLEGQELDHTITLQNGVANWSINIPAELVSAGDTLTIACTVTDPTLVDPIVNVARIHMAHPTSRPGGAGDPEKRTGRGGEKGSGEGPEGGTADPHGTLAPGGMQMPDIVEVEEGDDNWRRWAFDEKDACHIVDDSDPDSPDSRSFTFYVNSDNVFLRTEMKGRADEVRLIKAKFVYGNVLVGLALLHDAKANDFGQPAGGNDEREERMGSPVAAVRRVSRALAPFLVPMIDGLGALQEDQITGLAQSGDSE